MTIRRLLPLLIIAALLGLYLGHLALPSCQTYDVPEDVHGGGSDMVPILVSEGWYGVPGDGAERLYSPAC